MNSTKNSIGFQLAKIVKLKRRLVDMEMKKMGISRTGWQILMWLTILNPCTQKELLKNLDIDAGHLARTLEEFEISGYITRTTVKDDRRCLYIKLTKYSKQHIEPKINEIIDKENLIMLSNMEEIDKKNLMELLNKLEINLETALHIASEAHSNE